MPKKVTMIETYSVTVSHQRCPSVDFEPDTVEFSSWDEAADAMRRALDFDKPEQIIVSVDKNLVPEAEWKEDETLADWPAERHIVRCGRKGSSRRVCTRWASAITTAAGSA